jgi:hypothetical protein
VPRGRARSAVAALLAALLAAVLLGACGGVARDASGDASGAGGRAGSAEAYRKALASATGPLSAALAGMAGTRSLKALTQRLAQAQQAAARAAQQLDQLTPPEDVRAEHADLVQAFEQLDADLSGLRDAVDGRELCASTAIMARLGTAESLAAVRDAGTALAAKGGAQGYRVDLAVPATPKEQNRRLANGQLVRQGSRTGRGELSIENTSDRDTLITLALGKRPALSVYVRHGAKDKVSGIQDGSYQIYFTQGVDWDPKARAFTRECSFQRFDDSFKFTTKQTATQTEWTTWTVTLEPATGGNAGVREVDPGDFPVA